MASVQWFLDFFGGGSVINDINDPSFNPTLFQSDDVFMFIQSILSVPSSWKPGPPANFRRFDIPVET